jgi:hypothetical protein
MSQADCKTLWAQLYHGDWSWEVHQPLDPRRWSIRKKNQYRSNHSRQSLVAMIWILPEPLNFDLHTERHSQIDRHLLAQVV